MPLKPGTRIFGRFVCLVVYAGVIIWLSLAAHPPKINIKWLSWDKLQHAGAYFFLTFFAGRAFLGLIISHRKAWRSALAFSILFGICMEMAQSYFTRVRTPDKFDIAANICGAAAIYLLACLIPQISGKPLLTENQTPPRFDGNTDGP